MKLITGKDLITMIVQKQDISNVFVYDPDRKTSVFGELVPVNTNLRLEDILKPSLIMIDKSPYKEEPTSEDDSLLSAKALDFLSRKAYRNSSNEERMGLIKLAKTLYPGG